MELYDPIELDQEPPLIRYRRLQHRELNSEMSWNYQSTRLKELQLQHKSRMHRLQNRIRKHPEFNREASKQINSPNDAFTDRARLKIPLDNKQLTFDIDKHIETQRKDRRNSAYSSYVVYQDNRPMIFAPNGDPFAKPMHIERDPAHITAGPMLSNSVRSNLIWPFKGATETIEKPIAVPKRPVENSISASRQDMTSSSYQGIASYYSSQEEIAEFTYSSQQKDRFASKRVTLQQRLKANFPCVYGESIASTLSSLRGDKTTAYSKSKYLCGLNEIKGPPVIYSFETHDNDVSQ
jgi:hypothetical protein